MKHYLAFVLTGLLAVMTARGQDGSVTPVREMTKSLERIASEVKGILVQENVEYAVDLIRKRKEFGITYQPLLVAPNDLVGKLSEEQLRHYAGMKLFDAVYAASLLKRQEAAEAVAVLEQIEEKLALRDFADINNSYLDVLKKAAVNPDQVDLLAVLNQMAKEYVRSLPGLMSATETAEYLIDSLYGFGVQMDYVNGALLSANRERLEPAMQKYRSDRVQKMVIDVFAAFDRMDEKIRIGGDTRDKLAVVKSRYELDQAQAQGTITVEQARNMSDALAEETEAIRMAILTPGAL